MSTINSNIKFRFTKNYKTFTKHEKYSALKIEKKKLRNNQNYTIVRNLRKLCKNVKKLWIQWHTEIKGN